MNIDNINEELETFLTKYSRFLSKDIYITKSMYDKFLTKYSYLYQECLNNISYYKENINYLKILKIKNKEMTFIKAHNKKYLKKHFELDKDYFDTLYPKIELNLNDREVILIMDSLTISAKNVNQRDIMIISKIRYLITKQNYKNNDIIVIVKDKKEYKNILKLLKQYNLEVKVYLYSKLISDYCHNNNLKLINPKETYRILENYFKNTIFSNKELLRNYITNFKYLHFNKDVYDYDTLNDYHNYMFMRKYLESGLRKNDYINKLINDRKKHLITINNEKVKYKEEVNIANYLYLNNIHYKILIEDRLYFKIGKLKFYYVNSKKEDEDNNYFKLYKTYDKGNLLSHLKTLLKNHNIIGFVMDKNILQNKIKNDCQNIYYKDFIDKIVIDYIYSNKIDNNLLNKYKDYYLKYLKDNNLIDEQILLIELSNNDYLKSKYLIMDNNYIDNNTPKLIIN